MIVELINTGTELMLGSILNTHQQWLCRELTALGYLVSRQLAIPDTASDIEQAVKEALGRADLIITTGGLGPTSDDLTRDLIAKLLGKRLHENQAALENIQRFFTQRSRPMPDGTRIQAQVPEGALVLQNAHGTAPGLAIEVNPNPFRKSGSPSWLIMLPGPPRELRPMFSQTVAPLLRRVLPVPNSFVCRVLRTSGLGESLVEGRVARPLQAFLAAGLEVGYCARVGQVDVRLSARGAEAERIVQEAEAIVRDQLTTYLFGTADDDLEAVLVRLLTERKQTVATAESCTGGAIAHRLTNVPGASAVFTAGLVTYSNEAKQTLLGVSAETLAEHGAVSEPVAREMAAGARKQSGADFALSTTGIAGPSGGTEAKPVGTVFVGLATSSAITVKKFFNPYDRETFKQVTSQQALDLLRQHLL